MTCFAGCGRARCGEAEALTTHCLMAGEFQIVEEGGAPQVPVAHSFVTGGKVQPTLGDFKEDKLMRWIGHGIGRLYALYRLRSELVA